MFSFDITLIASASLAVQIFVLILLLYGYNLKRKLKFNSHGTIMAVAVVAHAASIFLVMIPSFAILVSPGFVLPEPKTFVYAGISVHAFLGASAFTLGFWLLAAWRFKKDVRGCFSRKKFMVATFILWATAITLGVILFGIFYGPTLFG